MRKSIIPALILVAAAAAGCSDESVKNGVDGVAAPTVSSEDSTTPAEEPSSEAPPEDDNSALIKAFVIKSCKIGDYGVEAEGTLVNTSKETSDIMATIEVTDKDGTRVDEIGVIEDTIKPGQKVKWSGVGLEMKEDLPAKIACSVKTVDRFASN